jgi:ribonuclease H2 subunit B
MSVTLICPKNAQDILQLPHPKTSEVCHILRTQPGERPAALYEVITFEQPTAKQTLLLPDRIISQAPIHVATPIDPIFFLIAALEHPAAQKQRFVESDELLEPLDVRVKELCEPLLPILCDEATGYFRPSSSKMTTLIKARVEAVAAALPSVIADTLVTWPASHEQAAQLLVEARRRVAFGLVASYLPDTVEKRIAPDYTFDALSAFEASRKPSVIGPAEFIKRPSEEGSLIAGPTKKAKKGSLGVEALKKVNTKGMKSMTSFFAKKTK